MKHFYKIAIILASLSISLFTTSCEKNKEDNTTEPNVSLSILNTSANSIGIAVEFKNATECFLHIQQTSQGTLTAEEVISAGVSIEPTTTEYTFGQLNSNTEYTLYAVAKNSSKSVMENINATTTDESFDGYILSRVINAQYRNDNTASAGNYELLLGNTEEIEWEGDIQVFIDLYNIADEDPLNAVLPNGTYEPNTDYSPFSYNPNYTYADYIDESGEFVSSPILGTIEVSRQGAEYTIIVDGILLTNEQPIKAKYQGQIQFVQTGTSAYQPFTDNQEITFTYGQMRYWGNWYRPMADDCGIELFDGEFDEDGRLVSGFHLTIVNTFMPKYPDYNDPNVPLAEGQYFILPDRNRPYYYSQPYTFDPGAIESLYEELHFVGTRITYTNPATNTNLASVITEGSFNVEHSGDKYIITIDFITPEGVSIKGTFEEEMVIANLNDNDEAMPVRPWSNLTEDHIYNFPEETQSYFYLMGNQVSDNLDSWFVMLYAANDEYPDGYGDMFTTEILIESTNGLEVPTGTFEIAWETADHIMYPGFLDYANTVLFTYYGDLTPDHEGYSTTSAPISSGTVTISETETEGIYHFSFDMIDDKGNNITGEWTGNVTPEDLRDDIEQSNAIKNFVQKKTNLR